MRGLSSSDSEGHEEEWWGAKYWGRGEAAREGRGVLDAVDEREKRPEGRAWGMRKMGFGAGATAEVDAM